MVSVIIHPVFFAHFRKVQAFSKFILVSGGVTINRNIMPTKNMTTTPRYNFFNSSETAVKVTPQKPLTPKQLQQKVESEKKRQLRQEEKEDREKKRQEEKEEREKKKQEEKDERERKKQEAKDELEKLKVREKEEKQKQKDEKEGKKRLEREAKLKDKEDKKKEKEEKEEMKRKEVEEKERKKQMELEQKEKAAMVFSKFFVPKKAADTSLIADEKNEEAATTIFMPFSVKPDMRLAPTCRRQLLHEEKELLTKCLEAQTGDTYLKDLRCGKVAKRKSDKTWIVERNEDDVMIMEDNNEIIIAQDRKIETMRAKMLKFHENRRPAYFGTWRKRSNVIKATKPFGMDTKHFDYEVDSDDDWEDEGQGESLAGSDDEDKENVSENDYEEDNEFFVPHGYLSEGEGDDEDNVPLSPESHKAKLKLLKSTFEEEINSKTERLKPRLIGCVWEVDKAVAKVQDAFHSFLQARAMITSGAVQIKGRDLAFQTASAKKSLSERKRKQLDEELVPVFLQLVHGNVRNKMFIVNEFLSYMAAKSLPVEISKRSLGDQLKALATWMKCPEEGQMYNKFCWYVSDEVRRKFNADLCVPNKWSYTTGA